MAGITTLYSTIPGEHSLNNLLDKMLSASVTIPDALLATIPVDFPSIALGGIFPKHFQRKNISHSDESGTLLFYGELYNNLSSYDEAEYAHQQIKTRGISALSDLNGPFAIFLWNRVDQSLLAATDRLGRFPLFYLRANDGFCITTDLHPVFASSLVKPSLNHESVIDFLTIGFPLGEKTLFEGIQRATAGEYLLCSPRGIEKKTYWQPSYTNTLIDTKPMVETFAACNKRAMSKRPGSVVALSGGWDSRATIAVLANQTDTLPIMTFGEPESADVTLASRICSQFHLPHEIIPAQGDFFDEFGTLANDVITLGSGHTTVDIAFQLYAFKKLAGRYPMLLDSAGCEFRRGIRAKIAANNAKSSSDITNFLLSMYATGVWNPGIIHGDLFRQHERSTRDRLTGWLESLHRSSYEDQIDAFSWSELWSHHYAHGYPLQSAIIACHMPYSDNEFYDLFLQSDRSIRWSHKFHEAVIKTYQPSLEHVPISYGHVKVPYGEHFFRYAPMAYHRFITSMANKKGLTWLRQFDNSKPFRPYHRWYVEQLYTYVRETLSNDTFTSSGYFNNKAVIALLEKQKSSSKDFSHSISILLTLAQLLAYLKTAR